MSEQKARQTHNPTIRMIRTIAMVISHHSIPYIPPKRVSIEQSLDRQEGYDTIDSDLVKIVHDLSEHDGPFDIESALVEVDIDTMLSFRGSYHHMVRKSRCDSGRAVEEALDIMMEDARKLAQRSPILFRASFRAVVSRSKNIRYGVNTPNMFCTIMTSKGIKQLLDLSCAYCCAL